ncbi:YdeI/OmpD-associated family protein [Streptococcus cuniculipharyngis]|uniref:Thymidylate synthase n=1 Tax=Streptococcus cuniculipharyngis TaxID=1562651 RepID=A0A5C5SDB6_9STRE|nr:thymidylate synthase [Streptococcus cuniculipharyngis]TWS98764.1 thymidylate synthase [Streptococcus cuniculipharyngis]
MKNQLTLTDRQAFRAWLSEHGRAETECWLQLKRGRPTAEDVFYYLDAVEEALCFGWIDSTQKKVDGQTWQRFSPRRLKSNWTALNKARVKRLEKLGLMTDQGRAVLPDLTVDLDQDLVDILKAEGVWEIFSSFPRLYQEVRLSNLAFQRKNQAQTYDKSLARLLTQTRQGKLYGDWDDYGRLS